jgi:hypothetical protein
MRAQVVALAIEARRWDVRQLKGMVERGAGCSSPLARRKSVHGKDDQATEF